VRAAAAATDWRETVVFAAVGGAATATYFIIAMAGTAAAFPAWASSLFAYGIATLVSYGGHKLLTFRSSAPVSQTAPRFAVLALLQYAIALLVPALLADWIGLAPSLAYGIVCVLIPAISFVTMSRFVFRPVDSRGSHSGKEVAHE
jgi:putative flippase GtrA